MVWVRRHRNVGWLRQFERHRAAEALRDRRQHLISPMHCSIDSGCRASLPSAPFAIFTVSLDFLHFTDSTSARVGYHKHLFYRLMASFGFPVPEIRAMYCPVPDRFSSAPRHAAAGRGSRVFCERRHCPYSASPRRDPMARLPLHLRASAQWPLPDGKTTSTRDPRRVSCWALHDESPWPKGPICCWSAWPHARTSRRLSGEALASLRIVTLVRAGVPSSSVR